MLEQIFHHHIIDSVWLTFSVWGHTLPVTKHMVMMGIASGLLVFGVPLVWKLRAGPLRVAASALEACVLFIRDDIVISSMGEEGRPYTHYFCTLFFFILLCNLIGLVPFGYTATGNIAVTGGLALTTFALINFSGIKQKGLAGYVGGLVPHGVPPWLYPLLLPVELIGLCTKTFALCIRLFANMIAGHFVLLTLFGLIFIFGAISLPADIFLTIPFVVPMALFVTLLELLVAILQAYIFTFLTATFTGMAMQSH